MKIVKYLLLLLLANPLFAQRPINGELDNAENSGWHKIMIPSQIRSASKPELQDFRIYDEAGREVPYMVARSDTSGITENFLPFRIVSKTSVPAKSTTVVVQNRLPKINEITLLIANSAVTKKYRISGSDDMQNWYGLVNKDSLDNLTGYQKTSVSKVIPLPESAYKFLKLEFDDTKTLPINVLQIGHRDTKHFTTDSFVELTPSKVTYSNSPRSTLITLSFADAQFIDRIQFDISSPKLFRRTARVYINEVVQKRRKTIAQQTDINNFSLTSGLINLLDTPAMRFDTLFIEVNNGDSPPLQFSKIRTLQQPVYIIAELQKDKKYTISSGVQNRVAPDYDIAYFSDQITSDLPEAKIVSVKTAQSKSKLAADRKFWQQSWFMWICILTGGLAVAYFSFGLIKDMNKH